VEWDSKVLREPLQEQEYPQMMAGAAGVVTTAVVVARTHLFRRPCCCGFLLSPSAARKTVRETCEELDFEFLLLSWAPNQIPRLPIVAVCRHGSRDVQRTTCTISTPCSV
jgi:hypothetical protein